MFMANWVFQIATGWLSGEWDNSRMIFDEK